MSGWNKRWPVFIPKKAVWVIILLCFLLVCTLVGDVSAVETNKPGGDPTAFDEEPPPDRPMYFKRDEHPVSINTSTNEEGDSLVDQFDQMTEWGIISTKFKPSESEWDIQAADDFVVPAAEGNWKVTSIEAAGFFVSADLKLNNPDVETAHVYFYKDAGGVPGQMMYAREDEPVYNYHTFSNYHQGWIFYFSESLIFPAGRYWVSVQMDELNYNQKSYVWYWTERDGQNGHDFVIRNPGGAWMEDCVDWCDNIGPYPDLNYHLRGYRSLPYKGKLSTGEVYDIAEHGSQPLVYVSVPESDIVRVINVDTESIIESIPVGSEPKGLAISPDSTKLYVALYGGNAIDVVDTLTNTVIDTLVLTDSPSDLVYGGPGRLYAYLTHRIRSLDPDTGDEISILPNSNSHEHLTISPDGDSLCGGFFNFDQTSLACYDVSTDDPPEPIETEYSGGYTSTLDISSDNNLLYTAGAEVEVFRLDDLTQIGILMVEPPPMTPLWVMKYIFQEVYLRSGMPKPICQNGRWIFVNQSSLIQVGIIIRCLPRTMKLRNMISQLS